MSEKQRAQKKNEFNFFRRA